MDNKVTRDLNMITDKKPIKDKLARILELTDRSIKYVFSDLTIMEKAPTAVFMKCNPSFAYFDIGFQPDDYTVFYYPYAALTIYNLCICNPIMLEMIVDFIVFHELGHCLGGHILWLRTENIDDHELLQRIAIEWEADEFAYKLLKQKYADSENLFEALKICFDCFEKHHEIDGDSSHPSRDERLWHAVHIILPNNEELEAAYDNSRVSKILSEIETLKPFLQNYRMVEALRVNPGEKVYLW